MRLIDRHDASLAVALASALVIFQHPLRILVDVALCQAKREGRNRYVTSSLAACA